LRDLNAGDQANANWHKVFGNHCVGLFLNATRRWRLWSSVLDDEVAQCSITHSKACNFTILVHRSNFALLDVELDFNGAALVEALHRRVGSAQDLQSVLHVGSQKQLAWVDLQQREDLHSNHFGTQRA
jgi:hypothetical protein